MKVVGLVSGGKDSCFNMIKCIEDGHEIVCLANLRPPAGHDELDSYMYQTVGHDAIEVIIIGRISGTSLSFADLWRCLWSADLSSNNHRSTAVDRCWLRADERWRSGGSIRIAARSTTTPSRCWRYRHHLFIIDYIHIVIRCFGRRDLQQLSEYSRRECLSTTRTNTTLLSMASRTITTTRRDDHRRCRCDHHQGGRIRTRSRYPSRTRTTRHCWPFESDAS